MNVLNKQLHCLERKLSSKLVLKIFIIQVYKFEFEEAYFSVEMLEV